MFDVTDKRAVDRLAAMVVMLERREAEARRIYEERSTLLRSMGRNRVPLIDQAYRADMERALDADCARWTEAQSALASARELATDR